ncbi:endonuclease III [Candidatus Micrarchaeota archaeon]|nr:endonuclease III [Candidatus Micrarchaeota archaeon]
MLSEAQKRNAPVFSIGGFIENDPFRSLIFSILSARTKDAATLAACKKLFKKFPNARKLASANRKTVEHLIYGVGFYRQKAKYVIRAASMVVREFGGRVPDEFDELVKIPGVGRKVANVLLLYTFGEDRIPVDTHVHRISNRLGWVKTKTPEQTEYALMKLVPQGLWREVNHAMVAYGQTVCLPRNPKCKACRVREYCTYYKEIYIR